MNSLKAPTVLKDAMNNFSIRSGASDEYCKGLIVGVVSGLMATTGMKYHEAIEHASICLPHDTRMSGGVSVPQDWANDLYIGYMRSHGRWQQD